MSPTVFAANPSGRLVSLDVFRGLTIAGMVLVNNPGTWSSVYWPLLHAEWHGWTPTDLVFPFFLFIVGVSITLAFGRRVEEGTVKRELYFKVLKRAAIIFGLGLFLNAFPYFQLSTVRIPGVLQRIALCYLIASLIFLTTKVRTQLLIALGLLVVYWLLMTNLAAPGWAAARSGPPRRQIRAPPRLPRGPAGGARGARSPRAPRAAASGRDSRAARPPSRAPKPRSRGSRPPVRRRARRGRLARAGTVWPPRHGRRRRQRVLTGPQVPIQPSG